MRRLAPRATCVMAAVLVAACGLQPEDPALALRQGGQATAALKTVTATIKVTKGTITFQGFKLVAATAAVRLPDASDTTYTVREKDIQIGFEVVILNGHFFFKPPLLAFSELTPAQAAQFPDLALLFDPNHGLPAVIPAGRNPQYQAAEQVDGVDSHRVSATYSADQIKGLLPQLSAQNDVQAVIWVGGSDHYIRKAVLSGKFGDNGTDSTVEVDLSGFNSAVHITSPARTG
jgi:LppX/LprAFG-like lipoprotein